MKTSVKKDINSVKSAFLFREYVVKNVDFKINDDFNPRSEVKLDFKLNTDFTLNDNMDEAIVMLGCTVFDDYLEKDHPYYMYVEIMGRFSLEVDFNDEEIVNLCKMNATAVLFPYLRSFISNLTATAGVPNLLLPTVNINKLFE